MIFKKIIILNSLSHICRWKFSKSQPYYDGKLFSNKNLKREYWKPLLCSINTTCENLGSGRERSGVAENVANHVGSGIGMDGWRRRGLTHTYVYRISHVYSKHTFIKETDVTAGFMHSDKYIHMYSHTYSIYVYARKKSAEGNILQGGNNTQTSVMVSFGRARFPS